MDSLPYLDLPHHELCALHGWRHTCSGHPLERHHWINRSKLQKSPEAKRYCEKEHPEIFLVPMCHTANTSRLADSTEGQAVILYRMLPTWGALYLAEVIGAIPWKVPQPDLAFSALLDALPGDVVD